MQLDGQVGREKGGQDLLSLAERVSDQHRGGSGIERGFAELNHRRENLLCGWENVAGAPIGGFHDQGAGLDRFAAFRAPALPELEIPSIEQGIPVHFETGHGTTQDMSRRVQAQAKRCLGRRGAQIGVEERLAEFKHPFRPGSGNP